MTERGDNQRVDQDGVLELVQKITYIGGESVFVVDYFNGQQKVFLSELVADEVIWDAHTEEIVGMQTILKTIESYSLENWQEWFSGSYVEEFVYRGKRE